MYLILNEKEQLCRVGDSYRPELVKKNLEEMLGKELKLFYDEDIKLDNFMDKYTDKMRSDYWLPYNKEMTEGFKNNIDQQRLEVLEMLSEETDSYISRIDYLECEAKRFEINLKILMGYLQERYTKDGWHQIRTDIYDRKYFDTGVESVNFYLKMAEERGLVIGDTFKCKLTEQGLTYEAYFRGLGFISREDIFLSLQALHKMKNTKR